MENKKKDIHTQTPQRDSGVRINKYFTDCGLLSRRAAEKEILAGRVKGGDTVAAGMAKGAVKFYVQP